MKRRTGDRRSKPRFEIVGDLWGCMDTTASVLVQNICRGGALLDSPAPLGIDSTHWVTVLVDGQPHLVQFRVRHSRPRPSGYTAPRFSIGVEFLRLPPAVEVELRRMVTQDDVSAEA